jgi:hypothetical protein
LPSPLFVLDLIPYPRLSRKIHFKRKIEGKNSTAKKQYKAKSNKVFYNHELFSKIQKKAHIRVARI